MSAQRCRIATFNLENLDDRPGVEPALQQRIAALRPLLVALNADVLCLQELHGQPRHAPRRLAALQALLRDTPYAGFHCVATQSASGGAMDIQNLAILSRFPVLSHRQILNDLVPAGRYRPLTATPPASEPLATGWDRPALYAALDVGGERRLHVINLHLRAPLASYIDGQKEDTFVWRTVAGWAEGFYLAALKRAGQALELRLLVDQLFDGEPDARIAVCGDFNAEDDEVPLRLLRGDMVDTGNAGLARRELVPVERMAPENRRFSVVHAGEARMLDHILASKPLMTWFREVEIHNAALDDELVAYAAAHRSPESFHAPIVAEFAWS